MEDFGFCIYRLNESMSKNISSLPRLLETFYMLSGGDSDQPNRCLFSQTKSLIRITMPSPDTNNSEHQQSLYQIQHHTQTCHELSDSLAHSISHVGHRKHPASPHCHQTLRDQNGSDMPGHGNFGTLIPEQFSVP